MQRAIYFLTLLCAAAVHANRAPVVSNVQARQEPGTMLVHITYDVADADADALTISVQISDDGGQTFGVPARTFSGDVGPDIDPGAGKRIVWDAGADTPDVYGTNFRPKVVAEDGHETRQMEKTATLPGGMTMDFVWIPPGTFTMGSPDSEEDRGADEGPQREVTITQGFYMARREITQAQWVSVLDVAPWAEQRYVEVGLGRPAVYISWHDVQEFVGRLNEAAGEHVYRLPTEAEWEYAARAGTTTRWSFGEDENQLWHYAWYTENAWSLGMRHAMPTGVKRPNPWGLFDMHGNAWEWVQDWFAPYDETFATVDPQGPETGTDRVIRSGYFGNNAPIVRTAARGGDDASTRIFCVGARLVRTK